MRTLRLALLAVRSPRRPRRWAARRDDHAAQDLPIGVRARDGGGSRAAALRSRRPSTGRGRGTCSSGRAASPAAGAPGGAPRPRTRTCPTPAAPRARRAAAAGTSATPTGSARPTGSRTGIVGRRPPAARLVRLEPRRRTRRCARVSMAGSPQIVPRAEWRANEEIMRAPPRYAKPRLASRSSTTPPARTPTAPRASAAIVRGDRALPRARERLERHRLQLSRRPLRPGLRGPGRRDRQERDRRARGGVQHRFGRGRRDRQLPRPRSSVPRAEHALARLLAWRLDVAHVDPLGTVTWTSGGNPKYPRGTNVTLRAISGHRDTGFTSCPGTRLYA